MSNIEISAEAASAAQSSIDGLAAELEASGKYPDLSYENAPIATAASDSVGQEWTAGLRQHVAGLESLGFAFTVVAETFSATDTSMSDTLDDLEMARFNAGDAR